MIITYKNKKYNLNVANAIIAGVAELAKEKRDLQIKDIKVGDILKYGKTTMVVTSIDFKSEIAKGLDFSSAEDVGEYSLFFPDYTISRLNVKTGKWENKIWQINGGHLIYLHES